MTGEPGSIRLANAGDLTRIERIEREAFADAWGATAIEPHLGAPSALVLLAESESGATGYALFQRAGGEAELLRIGTIPRARGLGFGTQLLRAGLRWLREAGDSACFLEVRAGNVSARRLYERAGFLAAGRRRGYYSDGEEARLYRLDLVPPPVAAG